MQQARAEEEAVQEEEQEEEEEARKDAETAATEPATQQAAECSAAVNIKAEEDAAAPSVASATQLAPEHKHGFISGSPPVKLERNDEAVTFLAAIQSAAAPAAAASSVLCIPMQRPDVTRVESAAAMADEEQSRGGSDLTTPSASTSGPLSALLSAPNLARMAATARTAAVPVDSTAAFQAQTETEKTKDTVMTKAATNSAVASAASAPSASPAVSAPVSSAPASVSASRTLRTSCAFHIKEPIKIYQEWQLTTILSEWKLTFPEGWTVKESVLNNISIARVFVAILVAESLSLFGV
jgi:hypothetical protein